MRKLASTIFKLIGLILVSYGLIITYEGYTSIFEFVSYFTIMANILVGIVLLVELLNTQQMIKVNQDLLRRIKGSAIIATLIMFIVYNFILIPYLRVNVPTYQIYSVKDIFIHYLSPLIIFTDYLLFDKKGMLVFKDSFKFINFIFIYMGYVVVYVLLGGRYIESGVASIYPYFFLNIETQGLLTTLIISLSILAFYLIIGLGFVYLDHLIKKYLVKSNF